MKGGGVDLDVRATMVYGVKEPESESDYMYSQKACVEPYWLYDNFTNSIDIFTDEVVNDTAYGCIYGFELKMNRETGTMSGLTDKKKELVEKLYSELLNHYKQKGSTNLPELGYFFAIKGSYEKDFEYYMPIDEAHEGGKRKTRRTRRRSSKWHRTIKRTRY